MRAQDDVADGFEFAQPAPAMKVSRMWFSKLSSESITAGNPALRQIDEPLTRPPLEIRAICIVPQRQAAQLMPAKTATDNHDVELLDIFASVLRVVNATTMILTHACSHSMAQASRD